MSNSGGYRPVTTLDSSGVTDTALYYGCMLSTVVLSRALRRDRSAASSDRLALVFGCLSSLPVVAALVGVYLLPTDVRRSFAFEYADPTLVTAYTAHFVHFTLSHLLTNLSAFALANTVVVALLLRSGDRTLLGGLFATLFCPSDCAPVFEPCRPA